MNAVKVQYTVKLEFVEKNKENIRNVIKELQALGDTGITYDVFLLEDGKTFVHLATAREGTPGDVIGKLTAFKTFREGHQGNLEVPPQQDILTFVAGSLEALG